MSKLLILLCRPENRNAFAEFADIITKLQDEIRDLQELAESFENG